MRSGNFMKIINNLPHISPGVEHHNWWVLVNERVTWPADLIAVLSGL